MPAHECERHGPFGPNRFCIACHTETIRQERDEANVRYLRVLNALADLEPFLHDTLALERPEGGYRYDPNSPMQVNPRIRRALKIIEEFCGALPEGNGVDHS